MIRIAIADSDMITYSAKSVCRSHERAFITNILKVSYQTTTCFNTTEYCTNKCKIFCYVKNIEFRLQGMAVF